MQKKILLAVDDSLPSKKAVRYAVQMSSMVPDLAYVLFHVQPMVSLYLQEDARKRPAGMATIEKVMEKNDRIARKLLDDCRSEMENNGIAAGRLETVTTPRKLGYAKDILEFALKGQYDAIVVGRRGVSGLLKVYSGSVTSDMVEHSKVIPVWLVDGDAAVGDILVAVDGSEASLRAVDHVGFILSGNSDARLTLLHVSSSAAKYCEIDLGAPPDPELAELVTHGDKACVDQFYSHALKKLQEAGIAQDRIRMERVSGGRQIGRVILDFARKANCKNVVVGRRGIDRSFFMGSVSRYMVNNISDLALWVVP